eukprot:749841-Hanusia_phi.AAC.4
MPDAVMPSMFHPRSLRKRSYSPVQEVVSVFPGSTTDSKGLPGTSPDPKRTETKYLPVAPSACQRNEQVRIEQLTSNDRRVEEEVGARTFRGKSASKSTCIDLYLCTQHQQRLSWDPLRHRRSLRLNQPNFSSLLLLRLLAKSKVIVKASANKPKCPAKEYFTCNAKETSC